MRSIIFIPSDFPFDCCNRLPSVPCPRMSVCVLVDAADIDRAKQIELEYMSVDDLKKYVLYILSV